MKAITRQLREAATVANISTVKKLILADVVKECGFMLMNVLIQVNWQTCYMPF